MGITSKDATSHLFTRGYKYDVFLLWYEGGQPAASSLRNMLNPDPTNGRTPGHATLQNWIIKNFRPKADVWDRGVDEEMKGNLVQAKLEMLARHAKVGKQMQIMAIDYLNDHLNEITPAVAAKLLIEGIKVERVSLGIPEAIEKMVTQTDEELMGELKKILTSGKVTIEAND